MKPEDILWVKRTFRAAAKKLGHDPSQRRLPLTVGMLVRVRTHIALDTQDGRALWAILCVGVYTLARIGELVPGPASELKVRVADLSMRGGRGELFLVGTKTDVMRRGVTLYIFRNDTSSCPFTAMRSYLAGRGESRADSPLFVDARGEF